jgi:hypothetical protein
MNGSVPWDVTLVINAYICAPGDLTVRWLIFGLWFVKAA